MVPQLLLTLLSNPLGVAAAATPFIVNHINSEKAKLDAKAAHRNDELKRASDAFVAISAAMDQLHYLSKQAMFAIVFRKLTLNTGEPSDVATFKLYNDQLMKWECSVATNRAWVSMCFGEESGKLFTGIQKQFERLAECVNAGFFKRTQSAAFIEDNKGSPSDFRTRYLVVWDRSLENMTVLSARMLRDIQDENVGSLRQAETAPPEELPEDVPAPQHVAPSLGNTVPEVAGP